MKTNELTTYLIGFDSDNKECLINRLGSDLFEIISESNSGIMSARFTSEGAKLAGYKTARVNGVVVYAKQSMVNRFMAQVEQRKREQAIYR